MEQREARGRREARRDAREGGDDDQDEKETVNFPAT